MSEEYLTTAQAAEFLKTNPTTLRNARISGKLWSNPAPCFYKAGERKILYPKSGLIEFIEKSGKRRINGIPDSE